MGIGHEEPEADGIGETPAEAIAATLLEGWFIPLEGYEREAATSSEVLFVYRAGGKVRVAIIAAFDFPGAEDRWAVVEIWACELEEFGAGVELGHGVSVWVNGEGLILVGYRGASHCDLASATFLHYPARGDDQYVRDPQGIFDDELASPYDGDTALPDDARKTGYRQGEGVLWVARDGDALYVVRPDRVERWPRDIRGIGCA